MLSHSLRSCRAPIFLPCNVSEPGQIEALLEAIKDRWGRLGFLFHSVAWARKEDLHGRLTDCSAESFAESMLISCHPLIRMAKLAEPLMKNGGSLMTLTYYGSREGRRSLQRVGSRQGGA